MTLEGIMKLPISVNQEESIEIYKQLAETNLILGKMDALVQYSIVNDSLLSLLSFNESVQSTRIEGTQVTFHHFMENKDKAELNWQEKEVENYHTALMYGIDQIRERNMPISTRLIKEIHQILMRDGRGTSSSSGDFRKIQNFIGPSNKIEDAVYIPVSPHEISEYMENLEFFINRENHLSFAIDKKKNQEYFEYQTAPLIKMAIAHAQFESIHPFLDGNGRLGRILLVLLSVKESLVNSPIFYVSEELEKERIRYYNLLNATRGENPNWASWILFFLRASKQMAKNIIEKLTRAERLAREGVQKCKTEMQKNIWLGTFAHPICTPKQLSDYLHIHPTTAKKNLDYLVDQNMLDKDLSRKRNQRYYNYDLLRTINQN